MSNEDQLDGQLRDMAKRSMDRQAEAVDTDAALAIQRTLIDGPRIPGRGARPWLAVAAALVIVAAGVVAIAWSRGGNDTELVATETGAPSPSQLPSSTGAVSVTAEPMTETTVPVPAISATASPSTIRAGETVEITPAGSVQRTCNDIVTLVSVGADQTLDVGQIVSGEWVPVPSPGTPVTYLACDGTTSDEPVLVNVPDSVPAGEYDLCVTEAGDLAGCARVTIVEPIGADQPTSQPAPGLRPVFDPEICVMNSALEGDSIEQPVAFFAKPSAFPVPLQVFADPDLGAAGPIVMVMRFRDRPDDQVSGSDVVELANTSIRIRVLDNGIGEATWTAADGTTGYLRSRNVDLGALAKTISFASVRELGAPIPGFDFFSNQEQRITDVINGQLELTAEAMNTDLPGSFRSSECTVQSTGFVYRTGVLTGGPVFRIAAVLDRPAPLEVGESNGSVIIINGNESDAAPRIEDLRGATELEWNDLLGR